MKASDAIVQFLIDRNITDVFGYPGGMVTHLMDSLDRRKGEIEAHLTYHEQGASFAACGYAQAALKPGAAYATSGPGATNLITGICNAYFDSIPVIFITGQVNTYENGKGLLVRQKGFQETDIVSMVRPVTKYCDQVETPQQLMPKLNHAYHMAMEGRCGPVLLDIPMDIQRSQVDYVLNDELLCKPAEISSQQRRQTEQWIRCAQRPCILAGAGLRQSGAAEKWAQWMTSLRIPVITSMIAVDLLPSAHPMNFGFLGAYGDRCANFIVSQCDVLITLGSRLDVRQTGARLQDFAPHARLIRVDIDDNELTHSIKEGELDLRMDLNQAVDWLGGLLGELRCPDWIEHCEKLRSQLEGIDDLLPNQITAQISRLVPSEAVITSDVGQNQVWVAQSFEVKKGQTLLFSGGHGAMGYSLPAAIGAWYARRKPVFCFCGDGGFQMNLQELQLISAYRLPVKIFVYNNRALGMIRHFQQMYFDCRYVQTLSQSGYFSCDLEKIAAAYHIPYHRLEKQYEPLEQWMKEEGPALIEIVLPEQTLVQPKLAVGKPGTDQEPPLDRKLYRKLMEL